MSNNRMFQNAKWIIACKVAKCLIQMIIGMITVRYLGPSNYGLVTYAASVVAFAIPIMQVGMSSTLIQEYVNRPEAETEIAGTSIVMSVVSSIACMVGTTCFAAVANHGETTTIIVCALYSIGLLFQATEMLQYWFQAKLLSKYPSLAILGAYLLASIYRIWLLISGRSVYWFALSNALEYAITSVLFFIAYKKLDGGRLRFSWKIAREMFRKSKYYILSNLMVTIFHNTDHIMIKLISGDAENGFYSAALTCSSVMNFVYTAIIDSGRPIILEKRKVSREVFEDNVSRLYSIIIYMTVAQSTVFTLLAKPIVLFLYGEVYLPAVRVLQIVVWSQPFSYISYARDIWILGEEKHNVLWTINFWGVIGNVVLNAVMIPMWGACGAAAATVLTYFGTNVIMSLIVSSIRPSCRLMLRGLNPRYLLDIGKKILRK